MNTPKLAPISALDSLDAATCAALRARLRDAGFTSTALDDAEVIAPRMPTALRIPLVRVHLKHRPGPASTLLAVFVYHFDVPADEMREALGDVLYRSALDARLLDEHADGRVSSRWLLLPFAEHWYLSDPLENGEDAVMGPGMTTVLLHGWSEAFEAKRVLDLGCGAGSLAVAAAARGAIAVAADLNERALAVARFNARLNGVTIETRGGDVAETARGEEFDLVLAQPPYFAQPESEPGSTYLHGGRYGDELALRFVEAAARRLAPGGTALVLFDFAQREGALVGEKLREAVGDAEVTTLAITRPSLPLDLNAVHTAAWHHPELGPEFEAAATAYREHFHALGVTGLTSVLVVLRRPRAADGPRWRVVLPHSGSKPPSPAALHEQLRSMDAAGLPDGALLPLTLVPARGARFEGEWKHPADPDPLRLSVVFEPGSFGSDRELGTGGWHLFALFDGSRTLSDVVREHAQETELGAAEAAKEVLGFVREGLARGLLRVGD
ncbi:MAG: methyltransferase [Candidatus Eisenbacteria bacterium]|uniref:Methyltransferase n=1 Tax=Eiseniibacteriota bacterium TaxID=2212470 RepID=A0A933SB11_UNCEI|nr:methyltransferase [Candidatus Eisenbacteria bacterium]